MASFEELLSDLVGYLNPTAGGSPQQAHQLELPPQRQSTMPANALRAAGQNPAMAWIEGPNRFGGEMRSYAPSAGEAAGGQVNALLRGVSPQLGERVGGATNALMTYGQMPAQFATDVAMQPVRAGEAVGEAVNDPSSGNVTNALMQTAATFGGPTSSVARRVLTSSPLATGVVAGAAGALAPSSASPQSAASEIQALQQRLQAAGYYRGPIDGRMGPGTQEAQQRFQNDQAQREQAELARQQAEAAKAAADAQARAADAQSQETERRRQAEERAAQQREEGQQRLRDIDKNTPWYQEAWQEYGPYAGYAVGMFAGAKTRGSLSSMASRKSEEVANRANALMETAGRGSVPGRVGNVNQFYTEGLRGSEAPFLPAPQRKGYPYRSNPNAARTEDLYQPSEGARLSADLAIPVVGGVERGVTEIALVRPAREELHGAQEALASDPSEANIQRFLAAKDKLAAAEAAANAGTGVVLGSAAASVKGRLGPQSHTRPNVAAADAERGRLDALLNAPGKGKRKGP